MADENKPVSPPSGPLCDGCRANPPEHVVTDVDKDGQKVKLNLCSACARERGLLAPETDTATVASLEEELKSRAQADDDDLVCPRCNLSYAGFKKTMRLGCEECYVAFAERLLPVLKRVHNATRHTGHVPPSGRDSARDFELQRLRRELKQAIHNEDYERAAAVRDRIRAAGGEL